MKSQIKNKSHFKRLLDGIVHSWWTILFILFVAIFYEREATHLYSSKQELIQKLHELESEKNSALLLQEELQLRTNSQNDPEWIELVLMKNLGLVPEGQQKIYIKSSSSIDN